MRNAFEGKEYGFFFHFLYSGDSFAPPTGETPASLNAEDWNRKVDAFDVKKVARQLHELKAGYAFITLGQNSGYYCVPNSVYTREVGEGWCARRDLVRDFALALAEYGIDCYLYTTTLAPAKCRAASGKLQSVPPWNSNKNCGNYEEIRDLQTDDPRLKHFIRIWSDIHREWSERWGKLIKGWWVDGGYFPEKMFAFPDEPNGHTFCRALRAGNPDAVVAFNPGVKLPCRNYPGSDEDYTAGETNEPQFLCPPGKFVDGLRYQILTYVGSTWGLGPLRGSGAYLASITRNVVDPGGVITWDVPFTVDGISDEHFKVLKEFASEYERSKKVFPKLSCRVTPPADGKDGSVTLSSPEKFSMQMIWNGVTKTVSSCGTYPLSALEGSQELVLECGSFRRVYPVFCSCAHVTLEPGRTHVVQEDLTTLTLSTDGKNLIADADVKEPESRPTHAAWDGSGLEFFLSGADGTFHQYNLRSDGTVLQYHPQKQELSGIIPAVRTAEGYHARIVIPLPSVPEFRLEVRPHVWVGDGYRQVNLFGGQFSGCQKIEYYAVVRIGK